MRTTYFLFFALIFALSSHAYSQTTVSGIIERETRWNAEDGPFIVVGDILVTRRASLIIAPGTQVIIKDTVKTEYLTVPFDKADSTLISIRVQGALTILGRRNNPITFTPQTAGAANFGWRGIIIDEADSRYAEIAFAEISGAATGITIKRSNAIIRNNVIENCNIGIHAMFGGSPRIQNNLITSSFAAAIKVERSNPQISNNIIAFNKNIGIWCDNSSRIRINYNCFFGNRDGNFLDCDPELGRLSKINKNKDSTDAANNIMSDPVFVGSPAEARAIELDVNVPTDPSRVRDTAIFRIVNAQRPQTVVSNDTNANGNGSGGSDDNAGDTSEPRVRLSGKNRFVLSAKYSPCLNAGDPARRFNNPNGKRNTIGPEGGPEFLND
ncbi:MAG: right-handed parallel beta-helix repeat-containing protein [Chitinispirillia bacterium]|nr:right-handed parallel beta-helix repeat-containing protein [Chitinispirillia bacterium]